MGMQLLREVKEVKQTNYVCREKEFFSALGAMMMGMRM
jgi:hypothetical protein